MQIPDHRIKKIAKLMSEIKQWNDYHPQKPMPCGMIDKIDEDLAYMEEKLK